MNNKSMPISAYQEAVRRLSILYLPQFFPTPALHTHLLPIPETKSGVKTIKSKVQVGYK